MSAALWFLSRPDGHQNNLRSAAYEALMEIVKNSAKDCYPAVQKTTLVIMERLQQVLQMEVSPAGRRSGLYCERTARLTPPSCAVSHPEHLRPDPVQRPAVAALRHSAGEARRPSSVAAAFIVKEC